MSAINYVNTRRDVNPVIINDENDASDTQETSNKQMNTKKTTQMIEKIECSTTLSIISLFTVSNDRQKTKNDRSS